jgi:hypothetical protein
MSTDTMVRLLSSPWVTVSGEPLSMRPLPGLSAPVVQELESAYPGFLNSEIRRMLRVSCGLTGTALGDIDFTGQWYPEEPLAVFRPCLSLAVDAVGRRWIAEAGHESRLPGPVWCVFREPPVTVYVSDDLAGFVSALRDRARRGRTLEWLRELSAEAHFIWDNGRALGIRSRNTCRWERELRGWLCGLPYGAYVYDLRTATPARGLPHGLGGATNHLYRCGRLPVFAIAAWAATDDRRQEPNATTRSDGPQFGALRRVAAH